MIRVALICLLLTAAPASAAVGNTRLAKYFAPDPIGGSPVTQADLQVLVTLEQRAMSAIDRGAVVSAPGWSNAKAHTRFLEIAVALSRRVAEPGANARETVTSACGTAGGSVGAFHSITAVPNGYEATCRPLVRPNARSFEVVAFVKMNVFVIVFGSTGPGFSVAALDTLARGQYGLIPRAGIPRTTLA